MKFRVWTLNFNDTVSVMTDWTTLSRAHKFCVGRWGHIPSFVVISTCKTKSSFHKYHGR